MVVVRRKIAPVMAAPPPKTRTQSTNQQALHCSAVQCNFSDSASVPCGCYACVRSKKQVSRVQSGLQWLAAMTTVRRFTQALKCSRNAGSTFRWIPQKIFAVWH
jgi:hypothetical protein